MARKRNYARAPSRPRPVHPATGDTFLIVVEGEATEVQYFDSLRLALRRKSTAVVVWHGNHTDPIGMVREALALREARATKANKGFIEAYNQTWVVFDGESQVDSRRKQIVAAVDLAVSNGVQVALSIPTFEFWLLLHYEYTTQAFRDCSAVKKALKKHIRNYDKTNLPMVELFGQITNAMTHASRCHCHWDTAGGDRNPSTEIDKLVRKLNDSARDEVRLF